MDQDINRSLPVPVLPRVSTEARGEPRQDEYLPAFPTQHGARVCTMEQDDEDEPGATESYTLTSLATAGFYLPEFPMELQYFSYRKVNDLSIFLVILSLDLCLRQ